MTTRRWSDDSSVEWREKDLHLNERDEDSKRIRKGCLMIIAGPGEGLPTYPEGDQANRRLQQRITSA